MRYLFYLAVLLLLVVPVTFLFAGTSREDGERQRFSQVALVDKGDGFSSCHNALSISGFSRQVLGFEWEPRAGSSWAPFHSRAHYWFIPTKPSNGQKRILVRLSGYGDLCESQTGPSRYSTRCAEVRNYGFVDDNFDPDAFDAKLPLPYKPYQSQARFENLQQVTETQFALQEALDAIFPGASVYEDQQDYLLVVISAEVARRAREVFGDFRGHRVFFSSHEDWELVASPSSRHGYSRKFGGENRRPMSVPRPIRWLE